MCIFKLISFLKVNQHAQHSNGSFWFVLLFNVNLQTYFVFESKLTFTTFKWLFKVCALLQCVSSNIFPFWKSKIKIKIKTMSFWSDICPITWEAPGQDQLPSSSNPPSRSSAWSAWTCGLWANQWQCSSEEIFAQPLETTIVNKYTTLHKSFGLSDIVCCDLWLVINLKLATGMESGMV